MHGANTTGFVVLLTLGIEPQLVTTRVADSPPSQNFEGKGMQLGFELPTLPNWEMLINQGS